MRRRWADNDWKEPRRGKKGHQTVTDVNHDTTRWRRIRAVSAALTLGLASLGWASQLTPDQWRQDLRVLATELPRRHKNLFHTLPQADFEKEVRQLDEAIPHMSEIEIRAGLTRLVASVGNVHTSVDAFSGTPAFPIAFQVFPEGFYVTHVRADLPRALGARLLAVNGAPIDSVRPRLLPYFAKENRQAELVFVPRLLTMAAPLLTEGVIQSPEQATYTLEADGKPFDLALQSGKQTLASAMMPRAYREHEDRGLNYWFERVAAAHTVYVQYNVCANMKPQSFRDFSGDLMKTVREHGAERMIVDLRFNLGGDASVVGPLVKAVESDRRMRVQVLVGWLTYSSGAKAALDLKHAGATLIGEAMGQRPNAYGNVRPLRLPNSGLTVSYAVNFWRYITTSDPDVVEPDVPVATTAADYFAGIDGPLNYALSH